MKKLLFIALILFVVSSANGCAWRNNDLPNAVWNFKTAPVSMDLAFDKSQDNMEVLGTIQNNTDYPVLLNIATKIDTKNLDVQFKKAGTGVAEYESKERCGSLPPLYYFATVQRNSTEQVRIKWKNPVIANNDTLSFYLISPVKKDFPPEEIHIDINKVPANPAKVQF